MSIRDYKINKILWILLIVLNINCKEQINTPKKYIDDAYKLMKEHQHKADFIDELPIHKPNHVSGMLFNIEGAAASPFQFYLTDSIHHFLRGSLYFNAQTKPDSMAPIFQFVKKDIIELINTFEWK